MTTIDDVLSKGISIAKEISERWNNLGPEGRAQQRAVGNIDFKQMQKSFGQAFPIYPPFQLLPHERTYQGPSLHFSVGLPFKFVIGGNQRDEPIDKESLLAREIEESLDADQSQCVGNWFEPGDVEQDDDPEYELLSNPSLASEIHEILVELRDSVTNRSFHYSTVSLIRWQAANACLTGKKIAISPLTEALLRRKESNERERKISQRNARPFNVPLRSYGPEISDVEDLAPRLVEHLRSDTQNFTDEDGKNIATIMHGLRVPVESLIFFANPFFLLTQEYAVVEGQIAHTMGESIIGKRLSTIIDHPCKEFYDPIIYHIEHSLKWEPSDEQSFDFDRIAEMATDNPTRPDSIGIISFEGDDESVNLIKISFEPYYDPWPMVELTDEQINEIKPLTNQT